MLVKTKLPPLYNVVHFHLLFKFQVPDFIQKLQNNWFQKGSSFHIHCEYIRRRQDREDLKGEHKGQLRDTPFPSLPSCSYYLGTFLRIQSINERSSDEVAILKYLSTIIFHKLS